MAAIERAGPARESSSSGPADLTLGQRRLLAWIRHHPHDPAYHQLSVIRLEGPWDAQTVRAALDDTVARHASLRSRFPTVDDGAVCVIDPHTNASLRVYNLTSLDPSRQAQAVRSVAAREARRPFDLQGGPLFRASLMALGDQEAVLVLCCHHLIIDGWSLGLLLGDLCDSYARLTAGHEGLGAREVPAYSIKDYASESIAWATSAEGMQAMRYWVAHLRQLNWSQLPHDGASGSHPAARRTGKTHRYHWSGIRALIDAAARSHEVTRYHVILCAFLAHVSRCTGSDDVAIATLMANRSTRERQALVGFLANTVILRHRFMRDETPSARLKRVSHTARDMLRHGATSLYQIASEAPGTIPGAPSILFSLQNNPLPAMQAGSLRLSMEDVDTGIAKFDLSVYVAETSDGLDLWVEFDTGLYATAQIDKFSVDFRNALVALCEDLTDAPAAAMASPAPRRDVDVPSVTATVSPTLAQATGLLDAFLETLASSPGKVALEAEGATHTFNDMQRCVALACTRLSELGAKPGDRLVVCGSRNHAVLAILWACQVAGLTYIPLPPDLPPARLAQILEDAAPNWRLADGHVALPGTWHDIRPWMDEGAQGSHALPVPPRWPASVPAYILYTSGSTGAPKGVVVTHGNLATFCTAMDSAIPRVEEETWLATSSLSFDISVLELLWSMSRGMRVRVATVADLLSEQAHSSAATHLPEFGIAFFGSTGQYDAQEHLAMVEAVAQWADHHDFRTVWTPERHFAAFGGFFSNPMLMAAHLLSRTRKLRVHAGSVVAPLHRSARLAEDWATLSRMSGGRAGLSLASGWNPADFVLADTALAERHDTVLNRVGDIRALWRGESVPMADAEGRFFDIRLPLPCEGHIPLSMTVSHHVEQFVLAAEQGLDVLTHLLEQDLPKLASNIERYREAWHRRHGDESPPGRVVLMVHTFVGHDTADAEAQAIPPLRRYLESAGAALRSLHAGSDAWQTPSDAVLDIAARRLMKDRSLIGDASKVRQTLAALYRIGVDEIAALVDFGVAREGVMASLDRLAVLRDRPTSPAPLAATHFQCTPSAARLLLQRPGGLPSSLAGLACWAIGGEAMDADLPRSIRLQSEALLLNMYGPTEATVWASHAVIAARRCGPVTLGTGLPGYDLRVLDSHLQPVPEGVPGQLFIAGDAVAQAYAGRPAATAAAFIPSPHGPAGARLYATGDHVSRRQDGTLAFLGRRDTQVKYNGHRIELDGLRALLLRHEVVVDAHVRLLGAATDGLPDTLVAFIVPRAGSTCPSPTQMHDYLAAWCDLAAIPRDFVFLPSFPITASHKLDTRQLDDAWREHVAARPGPAAPAVADGRFEELRRFWGEVLPNFDGHADFHRAGGNSLVAMRLLALTNAHFGADVSLADLYRAPTLSGHFNALPALGDERGTPLACVTRTRRYPVSFAQRAMLIVDALAAPGHAYHDAVALTLRGDIQPDLLAASYAAVMRRHRLFTTAYGFDGDDYYQWWREEPAAALVIQGEDADGDVNERVHAFRHLPFDLSRGDVARALLTRAGSNEHVICLVLHHIASDGVTLRIVLDEWLNHYLKALQGGAINDDEARWQYVDFADWQRRIIARRGEALEAFWDAQLSRISDTATCARAVSAYALEIPVELDAASAGVIDAWVEAHRVGEFAALAVPLLLSLRDTHEGAITLATDVRNRDRPEFDDLPGMMVNQIPLPLIVPAGDNAPTLLSTVHEQVTACFSHAELPYERIVSRWRHLTRRQEEPPFLVKLVLNEPTRHSGLGPLEVTEHATPAFQPKFGCLINLRRDGMRYVGSMVCDPALYTEDDMKALWDKYRFHLRALSDDAPPGALAPTAAEPPTPAEPAAATSVTQRLLQARRRVPSSARAGVTIVDDPVLPVARVFPAFPGQTLRAAVHGSADALIARVLSRGSILFCGFAEVDASAFAATVEILSGPALPYTERSTPRTEVGERLYSATEYPADQRIDLHNENSYAASWPGTLFFWCAHKAETGGENLLADSARLLERIPRSIVDQFTRLGVMYRREIGPPLGMSWRYVFQCETPQEVHAAAAAAGYDVEWHSEEKVSLRRRAEATVVHPVTGIQAWFNHALFFHESSLPADTRAGIATLYGEGYLPNASSFGDGSPIPIDVIQALRSAYADCEHSVLLNDGDVLVIDNLRVAHGRQPFTGRRDMRLMMGKTLGMTR